MRDYTLRATPFTAQRGHPQIYTETELDKLRRHLKFAEGSAERARTQAESERRHRIAIKGQLTKTKNRIANGVCPCCNRSFSNLQRHMSGQHPQFVSQELAAERTPSQAEVRKWAERTGKRVNGRGRIPSDLVEQYKAEGGWRD